MFKRMTFLALLLTISLAAWATSAFGFGVTPSRTEIDLAPGSRQTGVLEIRQREGSPARVTVEVSDWQMGMDGVPQLSDKPQNRSVRDWVTIDRKTFVLQPGASQKVRYTVQVPQQVGGTYWSAIVARFEDFEVKPPVSSKKAARGKLKINYQFLAPLYIHVGPHPLQRVTIAGISVGLHEKETLRFKVRLANPGIFGYRVTGTFRLTDPATGAEFVNKSMPSQMVLPQSQRDVNIDIPLPNSAWPSVKAQVSLEMGMKRTVEAERTFQFE